MSVTQTVICIRCKLQMNSENKRLKIWNSFQNLLLDSTVFKHCYLWTLKQKPNWHKCPLRFVFDRLAIYQNTACTNTIFASEDKSTGSAFEKLSVSMWVTVPHPNKKIQNAKFKISGGLQWCSGIYSVFETNYKYNFWAIFCEQEPRTSNEFWFI
jgi:hypothetical protein